MLIGLLFIGGAIALLLHNQCTAATAGESAVLVLDSVPKVNISETTRSSQTQKADSATATESESITMLGMQYAGILEIPVLELVLPVLAECTYDNLKSAPCRYTGCAANNDLVIAGHNYSTHFGKFNRLAVGNIVCFTDACSQVYDYEVTRIETLAPDEVKEMTAGEWPLTLFTCTYGGQNRVVVRCS